MTYEYEQYLSHHGIKGQKWGVRRFQNEDGSLTDEGKSRYSRGKEYEKERRAIEDQEYKKQFQRLKSSKSYQDSLSRSKYLHDVHGVDSERSAEYRERYGEKRYNSLEDEYWKHQDNMEYLQNEAIIKARKKSFEQIAKLHGKTALKDIDHYMNVNGVATFIAAVSAGALVAAFRHRRKHR